VPKLARDVCVKKWSLGKHISVLGIVSAAGKSFAPAIVVEAKQLKKSWARSYPEAMWGVDDAGYFAEGPFYDAMVKFVKDSEPEGGAADNPRVLFMDNYRSHLDPAVLKLLRAHNVRVVTFHPHTTHIFCVLDTSNFAMFKRVLKSYFDDDMLIITMDNIGEMIKHAWKEATKLTMDAMTGEVESAASKGFKTAGIVPFDRAVIDSVVDGKHAAIAKIFDGVKKETAAAGGAAPPAPATIRLTAAERAEILADFEKQHLEVVGYAATPFDAAKNRSRKAMSELATGSDFIAAVEAKDAAKVAEVAAVGARKDARAAAKADKAAALAAAAATKAADALAKQKMKEDKAKAAEVAKAAKTAKPVKAPAATAAPKRARAPDGDDYARRYVKSRK